MLILKVLKLIFKATKNKYTNNEIDDWHYDVMMYTIILLLCMGHEKTK
jgi:hypothetical protein